MDLGSLDIEKLANAIVVLVCGLAAGLGFRSGRKGTDKTPQASPVGTVEVAAALVDNRAVASLTGEVAALNINLMESRKVSYGHAERINANLQDLTEAVEKQTAALVGLKEEMIRRH
ncbi:hypothetical protein IFT84_17340 [Rhizobium sp. CFBP 8762]|uniref:hypothetical protein n=1 Tax=Rhizobium sp. CFBP 8762 TaxID=2775279 RepID=UPI001784BBEB|nr:hypothetical protein [Rhizobium sp. CFBP 8762]MBD8556275.1 hypothetical protein [Rhizobium sp. CFBP 8762]